jgi:hypothetical protein
MMDLLIRVMHKEEKKLLAAQAKIAGRLTGLRAAINALSTNGKRPFDGQTSVANRGSKLRGKKLSAAHRRAIKLGIAKRRKAQAAK